MVCASLINSARRSRLAFAVMYSGRFGWKLKRSQRERREFGVTVYCGLGRWLVGRQGGYTDVAGRD